MTRRITRGFQPAMLAEQRERAKLTAPSLARRSGVHAKSIRDWERGDSTPHVTSLAKVARALGKPISAFVKVPRNERMLSDLRVLKGLTQPEIAKAVGISTTFYAEIERGDKQPGDPIVKRMAEILETGPPAVLAAWRRTANRPPDTPA